MFRELDCLMVGILKNQPNIINKKREEIKTTTISFMHPSKINENDAPDGKVNFFLYDIRENSDLYQGDPYKVYDESKKKNLQIPPPLRIVCSYLVTAWMSGEDSSKWSEHHLLCQVAEVFLRHKIIKEQPVKDAIKTGWKAITTEDEGYTTNIADGYYPLPVFDINWNNQQKPFEFWPALGASMRPSLTITATISIPMEDAEEYSPGTPAKEIVMTRVLEENLLIDTPVQTNKKFTVAKGLNEKGDECLRLKGVNEV